jgi:hypothetical protein
VELTIHVIARRTGELTEHNDEYARFGAADHAARRRVKSIIEVKAGSEKGKAPSGEGIRAGPLPQGVISATKLCDLLA